MILGDPKIHRGYLETNNDHYPLTPNTTFSVVRPFRGGATAFAGMLLAFAGASSDLLYTWELAVVVGCAAALFVAGSTVAHLMIVNRDLRGSDLQVAFWGTYRHLNRKRREIAASTGGFGGGCGT